MTVELSERLAAVARYVPSGAIIADIGTDHAYLPVHLVQAGVILKAVAVDVHQGPYDSALDTVKSCGLEEKITLHMGDGLQILSPGEVDVVVIAGMGGKTVCNILTAGKSVVDQLQRLVLQPMRDTFMVRCWLLENGWRIVDEEMVREGRHFYVIIVAEQGNERIQDHFMLEWGPRLLEKRDLVMYDYLQKRLMEIRSVLAEVDQVLSSAAREKAKKLREEEIKIEEVLQRW